MIASRKLPRSLETNPLLGHWLRVNREGTVTVYTGKVEIGQGILTAVVQVAADELDVAIERIRLEPADTRYSPNEGLTSGSRSVEEGVMTVAYAAAEAREILLERGARALGVSLEQLTVSDGVITARSGGSISYWDLADDNLLKRNASGQVPLKPESERRYVGVSLPRRDILRKITGAPAYVQDLDFPGMVYGRVVRPPTYSARLTALHDGEVRALPGVIAVVRDGSFVGVVAEREEQAIRAARRLARLAQWHDVPSLPADMTPAAYLQAQPARSEVISEKSIAAAVPRTELAATYTRPFIAHASMAPSCAVAHLHDGKYQVWSHTQGIYLLRHELARALGVEESTVTVVHAEGAGCFGHNGADDAALDAALLARAVPEKPVHVQWMREDEFAWEPYGPAMVVHTRAALDESGNIVDWHFDVWSYPHVARPGDRDGVNLVAAWHLEQPFAPATPSDPPLPPGGSHRNAIPLYDFPNQRVTNHLVRKSPLRVSALRALGAHANVFAIESFMDELATAAGADPVEFRLRHLRDERARAVIEQVAQACGWEADKRSDGTRGRGIGFARYKNVGCYVAVVVEVEMETVVRVTRAWAAVDVGLAVNPDGVINQIEGGIIQSASMTTREQVAFDRERVTTRNWDDYPILKFSEAPTVQVVLLNRPDQPPVGVGEGATGPTAAAIANAVYAALGARVRDMPLTRERVIAALT
ncbi:MAG: molybdopterin cofactor-binding domain-containing protein [Pseudomonadota bacterium]